MQMLSGLTMRVSSRYIAESTGALANVVQVELATFRNPRVRIFVFLSLFRWYSKPSPLLRTWIYDNMISVIYAHPVVAIVMI